MTVSSGDSKFALAKLVPLEAVLFDIAGTLCDSDPLHYQAFREMLLEIGFNGGIPVDEEFFVQTIAGKHNDDIARALFPDDFERGLKFVDEKEAYFRKLVKEQLKPIPGLDKVRKWAEDRGLKRAAVTNAPRPTAELMVSTLGLSDFFEVVIVGSECEHPKPHPDPYFKGLEMLKASKEHTFIFEDSRSGIKAGVATGMPVISLYTRNPENLLMEAKPAFLIKDYEDPKLWAALEEVDKAAGVAKTKESHRDAEEPNPTQKNSAEQNWTKVSNSKKKKATTTNSNQKPAAKPLSNPTRPLIIKENVRPTPKASPPELTKAEGKKPVVCELPQPAPIKRPEPVFKNIPTHIGEPSKTSNDEDKGDDMVAAFPIPDDDYFAEGNKPMSQGSFQSPHSSSSVVKQLGDMLMKKDEMSTSGSSKRRGDDKVFDTASSDLKRIKPNP